MDSDDGDLRLLCLIEGDADVFAIDIERRLWNDPKFMVDDLKKKIKEERKDDLLNGVGAHSLLLWKPRDTTPIDVNVNDLQSIRGDEKLAEKLSSSRAVRSIFPNQPPYDDLHIIVWKPDTAVYEGNRKTITEAQKLSSEHSLHKLWMFAKDPQVTLFETRSVRRDEPPTETKLPSYCTVLNGGDWIHELQPDSHITGILIRDEYKEALQAIMNWFFGNVVTGDAMEVTEDDMEADDMQPAPSKNPFLDVPISRVSTNGAFVLTGNPGIGKTQFLYFLLFLRLQAGLPTIYQSRDTYLHYFADSGVFRIHLAGLVATDFKSRFRRSTWCLIDSNQSVGAVPVFIQDLDLFIVQASSPRPHRFNWLDKATRPFVRYFMKSWTLSELLVGRVLQPEVYSEADIESFSNLYGTAARSVYTFAKAPGDYDKNLLAKMASITYDVLDTLFRRSSELDLSGPISHHIILLSPDTSCNAFGSSFPTRYIYEKVREKLSNRKLEAVARLYDMYVRVPYTRANAGFMLEDAINDVFPRGGEWSLVNMIKSSRQGSKYTHWKSPNSTSSPQYLHLGYMGHHITIDTDPNPVGIVYEPLPEEYFLCDAPLQLKDGYYRPSSRLQPMFDAFIYESATATATVIQVTTSSTHTVKEGGIKWLQHLGVQKFRYIAVSTPNTPLDLPFLNEWNTPSLISEKYLLTVESLPSS